jgi:hypothetical protein
MAGSLGLGWKVAPHRCTTRRADYDDPPRRDSPSRIVSSDHGNGGSYAEVYDAREVVFCCRLFSLRQAHPYGGSAFTKSEA